VGPQQAQALFAVPLLCGFTVPIKGLNSVYVVYAVRNKKLKQIWQNMHVANTFAM